MKRIALLVTTALAAAGCTVSTCDPRDLSVTWDLVAADQLISPCTDAAHLGAAIDVIDVYLNGSLVTTVPCSDHGGTLADPPSGVNELMLEGRSSAGGGIRVRDIVSVNTDNCGTTSVRAYPGQAYLDYDASYCSIASPPTWFEYSLWETTFGAGVEIDSVTTTGVVQCSMTPGNYEISYPPRVPYGYYQVKWAEEYENGGAYASYSRCNAPENAVFYGNTGPFTLTMYNQAACP